MPTALIAPLRRELDRRGLTHDTIRYLGHDHATFKRQLARSRNLLFLCEHETQGIAYQEAMASGLPVLAWDRGFWADPQWQGHFDAAPPASSVPFFSEACGERFIGAEDFAQTLDLFLGRRPAYGPPRDYVIQNLDFGRSGGALRPQLFRADRHAAALAAHSAPQSAAQSAGRSATGRRGAGSWRRVWQRQLHRQCRRRSPRSDVVIDHRDALGEAGQAVDHEERQGDVDAPSSR